MTLTDTTAITTEDELRAVIGEPQANALDKERSSLVERDRDWLAASPFCMLGTSDAEGNVDVSPKGDPAGQLVHVIDDRTIAIAERPGNRRVDGYRNILENPHVGLNFVIPGRGDTLRINGRARLVSAAPFFDAMEVKGRRPIMALIVEIDTVFHHCQKAFLRSNLWKPETWHPTDTVPRRAVLAHELDKPDQSVAELDQYYGDDYTKKLY